MAHYDEFRENKFNRKFKVGDLVKRKTPRDPRIEKEFFLGKIIEVEQCMTDLPYKVEIMDDYCYKGSCVWCKEEDLFLITSRAKYIEESIAYDNINHPKHYTSHPSGVEVIQITEHLNFCLGNVIKYILRHTHKNGLEDLKKAQWYLNREIKRLENANN